MTAERLADGLVREGETCHCGAPISTDSGWQYCPTCGTSTCRLSVAKTQAAIVPASGRSCLRFERTAERDVKIVVESHDVPTVVEQPKWERLSGHLELDLSGVRSGHPISLTVRSSDGPRIELWTVESWRAQHVTVIPEPVRSEVELLPGLLLFGKIGIRNLTLTNRGNVPLQVSRIELPHGYRLGNPAMSREFYVLPGEDDAVTVAVISEEGSGDGDILLISNGRVVARAICLNSGAGQVQSHPRAVVSVDFGTSNTSAFVWDRNSATVHPIPLDESGANRVETVIQVGTYRSSWKAFHKLDEMEFRGVIRGLKTIVREEADSIAIPDLDEALTVKVHDLLVFYLRHLRETKIEPFLEQLQIQDGEWVETVFTLPVLDGVDVDSGLPNPDLARYRQRILAAAVEAGYEDPYRHHTICTLPEPDGGLFDALFAEESRGVIRDGERVLVIDCGGGTTDLTLAKIRVQGDSISVHEHLNAAAAVGGYESRIQFGGNLVTFMLGLRWVRDNLAATLSAEVGGPPEEAEERHRRSAQAFLRALRELYGRSGIPLREGKFEFFNDVGPDHEPDHRHPQGWFFRYPRLFRRIEYSKRVLCLGTSDQVKWEYRGDHRVVVRPQLVSAVDDPMSKGRRSLIAGAIEGILAFLNEARVNPKEISHVIPIGGAARLPQLLMALKSVFGSKAIRYAPSVIDTAVCRGAAQHRSVKVAALPIGVSVVWPNEPEDLLAEQGTVLTQPVRRQRSLDVPAGRAAEVSFVANRDGHKHALHSFQLPVGTSLATCELTPSGFRASLAFRDLRLPREFTYEF